jgi:hypothetical protein
MDCDSRFLGQKRDRSVPICFFARRASIAATSFGEARRRPPMVRIDKQCMILGPRMSVFCWLEMRPIGLLPQIRAEGRRAVSQHG